MALMTGRHSIHMHHSHSGRELSFDTGLGLGTTIAAAASDLVRPAAPAVQVGGGGGPPNRAGELVCALGGAGREGGCGGERGLGGKEEGSCETEGI